MAGALGQKHKKRRYLGFQLKILFFCFLRGKNTDIKNLCWKNNYTCMSNNCSLIYWKENFTISEILFPVEHHCFCVSAFGFLRLPFSIYVTPSWPYPFCHSWISYHSLDKQHKWKFSTGSMNEIAHKVQIAHGLLRELFKSVCRHLAFSTFPRFAVKISEQWHSNVFSLNRWESCPLKKCISVALSVCQSCSLQQRE